MLWWSALQGAVSPLPLLFEETPTGAMARTPGGAVAVDSTGALLKTRRGSVRLQFENATPSRPGAEEKLSSVSNYLTGNDRSKWRVGVPHFARVRSRNTYPGVDVVYYGANGQLEYDFVVSPGADPRKITLRFEGSKKLSTDAEGNLLIDTGSTVIRQLRPVVYQAGGRDSVRNKLQARYQLLGGNRVRFALDNWDRKQQLVIDPVIQYSRYLGREGQESSIGVAADAAGNAIYVGETTSDQFASGSGLQAMRNGDSDIFIAKLTSAGAVQFITYLGGRGPDTALGVVTDSSNNIYLTGITNSPDFPTKTAIAGTAYSGGNSCTSASPCDFDAFASKISADGQTLMFSSYLGGSGYDYGNGIALDPTGSLWVGGWTTSANFPVHGGYQSGPGGGGGDVFVTEIDTLRGQILYSTYLGGPGQDIAGGLAVDNRGMVYIAGSTTSSVLPPNPTQFRLAGKQDMFLFVLDPSTNTLNTTLFGGSGDDVGVKLAVDTTGAAYVAGYTDSVNLPVSATAAQRVNAGRDDMFVAKIAAGSVQWATYFGGTGDDFAGAITVDSSGSAYVAGWTSSANLPLKSAFQTNYRGGNFSNQQYDGAVLRLAPGGDSVLFSSYLGGTGEDKFYGITLDRSNSVLLAGSTTSSDYPMASNAFGSSRPELFDGTAAKLTPDTSISLIGANPGSLTLTAQSTDTRTLTSSIALTSTTGSVTFSATTSAPWLRVDPISGTAPSNIVASVNPTALRAGVNTGEIAIQSSGNTFRIPVTVTLVVVPVLTTSDPAGIPGGAPNTTIMLTGSGFVTGAQVEANGTQLQTTFVESRVVRAVVPTYLLQTGQPLSVVLVNPDGGRSNALTVPVGNSGPALTPSLVIHGATQVAAGPVSPGQVLVISGFPTTSSPDIAFAPVTNNQVPTSFMGVRVLFDNAAAPIYAFGNGAAAVVAPYSITPGNFTMITTEYNGVQSTPVRVPVQTSNPGLFTVNQSGTGQAAVLNADGSANSPANPAARGTTITLFGTGEGLVTPQVPSGSLVPVNSPTSFTQPVQVLIGGRPATVTYSGGAPGQVSGVFQINIVVPNNIDAGAVPVTVRIGDYSSPTAAVTVSII